MSERKLIEIEVKVGGFTETQSGFQRMKPRISGAYFEPTGPKRVAAIFMHPSNSMLGHTLLEPLAQRGIGTLGLGSRFLNNDSTLLMERVIQDLGAGVKFLRERGYEKVLLVGFSGGAALSCFFQAQAENLTITHTPAGDPAGLHAEDLPPADGIVLIAAHAGRSRLFLEWLDGSLIDEHDAQSCDPTLDIYNPDNGAPYSPAFLERYRAA
jgi:hypothetical protein